MKCEIDLYNNSLACLEERNLLSGYCQLSSSGSFRIMPDYFLHHKNAIVGNLELIWQYPLSKFCSEYRIAGNFRDQMASRENLFPRKFILQKLFPDKLRKLSALP